MTHSGIVLTNFNFWRPAPPPTLSQGLDLAPEILEFRVLDAHVWSRCEWGRCSKNLRIYLVSHDCIQAAHFFNVSSGDETLCQMLDITSQTK